MTKKLTSIGVLGQKENNIVFDMIKLILLNYGYVFIYDNVNFCILSNDKYLILIFQLTRKSVDKIQGLNLCLDVIIDTGLTKKDYNNPSIKSLVKNSKYFIMNIDEKDSINLLDESIKSLIVTYGLNQKATVTASSLTFDNKIRFNLCFQRECHTITGSKIEPMEFPITIDLIGRSNFYDSLAAISFGLIYGIPVEKIMNSLQSNKLNFKRLEKIYDKDYIIILDSYCEDSSDYNFIFEEIQYMKFNKLYVIKGVEEKEEFYKTRANLKTLFYWHGIVNIEKIFLYVAEKNNIVIRSIGGLFSNEAIKYSTYTDLKQCLCSAIDSLSSGDVLLILGKNSIKNMKDMICQLNL